MIPALVAAMASAALQTRKALESSAVMQMQAQLTPERAAPGLTKTAETDSLLYMQPESSKPDPVPALHVFEPDHSLLLPTEHHALHFRHSQYDQEPGKTYR